MKLAVLADSKGQILGLAVCRVTFSSEPEQSEEYQSGPSRSRSTALRLPHSKCYVLDLPSHSANTIPR